MSDESGHPWRTPWGDIITVLTRDDTADAALVDGLLNGDEYGLKGIGPHLSGVALDVGAHIGTISLALLAAFDDLSVVAVEPLPENCDLIRRGGASYVTQGRLHVEQAAAGAPGVRSATITFNYHGVPGTDDSYVHQNRYIGGMWKDGYDLADAVVVPSHTLAGLAERYAPGGFVLTKVDAEGAEYDLFSNPADNHLAGLIVGEWHDGGPARITDLLKATHRVLVKADHGGTGIFWAVPR